MDATLKLAVRYVENPWSAASSCAEMWRTFKNAYSWWSTPEGIVHWLRDDADGDMGFVLGVELIQFCRAVRLARKRTPEPFDVLNLELLTNWAWKLNRTSALLLATEGNSLNSEVKFADLAASTARVQKNFQDFIDAVAWSQSAFEGLQVPDELVVVPDTFDYARLSLDFFGDGFKDAGPNLRSDEKCDGPLTSDGVVTPIPGSAVKADGDLLESRKSHLNTLGSWCEDDREVIAESLSGQQLKLFHVLWRRDRWTHYGMLKNLRAEMLWRGQPDPSDISDSTVFEALRKLQKAMPPDSPYVVKIENESRRVKIER